MDENREQKVGEVKLQKPMEVLFEGADTEIYKKTKNFSKEFVDEMDKIPEKFLFLYSGHWLQGGLGDDRKDTGMLVKTFLETFKNKPNSVALLMKTSGATFSIIDRNEIKEKIKDIKTTVSGKLPNIYFLHGDMTDEEMNELYNHPKVKVHITFTHGEVFGRPLLEASLSEKPIIASDWSGHKDFLNKNNAVLLPGTMTKVSKSSFPDEMYVDEAHWFTINYQYASQVMVDIYKKYRKYSLGSKKLGIFNRVNFSMNKMTQIFEKILDDYLPKFEEQPQAVNLKLPKLKKVSSDKSKKINLPKLKKV